MVVVILINRQIVKLSAADANRWAACPHREETMSLSNIINYMRATSAKWKRFEHVLNAEIESHNGELSKEDVFRMMNGHANFDDPPPGWTKRDLAMYGRGYLHAEAVQHLNDAGVLDMMIGAIESAAQQAGAADRDPGTQPSTVDEDRNHEVRGG